MFREIKIKNFDLSQFETKQVFYPSKDGTKIPMFIVLKKVGVWFFVCLRVNPIIVKICIYFRTFSTR